MLSILENILKKLSKPAKIAGGIVGGGLTAAELVGQAGQDYHIQRANEIENKYNSNEYMTDEDLDKVQYHDKKIIERGSWRPSNLLLGRGLEGSRRRVVDNVYKNRSQDNKDDLLNL